MADAADSTQRLDSWKAIAEYLRRDVATVRRWEKTLGLPVRRVSDGRGASVFAYASEIDAWLTRNGAEEPPNGSAPDQIPARRSRRARWTAVLLAASLVMAIVATRPTSFAAGRSLKLSVTSEAISATDSTGSVRWRYAFPPTHEVHFSGFGNRFQVTGGDRPHAFVITGVRVRRSDGVHESGELRSFSGTGRIEHLFSLDDHAIFDGKSYGPPWALTAVAVDDRFGTGRIAVAAHHYDWSASLVTLLDADFRRLGTYWQWGWIEALSWAAPDRLLVAGFNDARNGGMLALLDPATLAGQAPEPPGAHGYCSTCGPVSPLRMVVMPRSEMNRATGSRFNRALLELFSDRVVARTVEVPAGEREAASDALYEFSPGLDVLGARFGGAYWELHDALQARGVIDHDRSQCPDRSGPRLIQTWDRAAGWRTQTINR